MEELVQRLKELRTAEGLSQRQLAAALKVSHVTVNQWEKGEYLPGARELKKLSLFFGVSADYLLGIKDTYL